MAYCTNCGTALQEGSKYCNKCGTPVKLLVSSVNNSSGEEVNILPRESVFFKGEGMLVIKKMDTRGAAKKAETWNDMDPEGFDAFGRTKRSRAKTSGELIVTNRAIYCAGNGYPFDRLIGMNRDSRKSVALLIEKDISTIGDTDRRPQIAGGISVEAVLKTESKEACDKLYDGLRKARVAHLT